jgi:hypothetical protein
MKNTKPVFQPGRYPLILENVGTDPAELAISILPAIHGSFTA